MFRDYVNSTYTSTENIWFSLYVVEMISSSHKNKATLSVFPLFHCFSRREVKMK